MKKSLSFFLLCASFLMACNNSAKDSVDKADSANQANRDRVGAVMTDENSSSFLVKVANAGMAEVAITSLAQEKAAYQPVKDFAAMLNHDHSALNEKVKSLGFQKNVVLPDSVSSDKKESMEELKKQTGKNFDKAFIEMMIKNHEASIDLFEENGVTAMDNDIRSLATNTLPTLRVHLDSAKSLQKRYWK